MQFHIFLIDKFLFYFFFDNACVLIWFLLYMSSICISNNMIWVQIGVQKL